MKYVHPGLPGSLVSFRKRYGNYIGGKFVEPVSGNYFTNTSPVTGQPIAEFPRSDAKDIELALDAAHAAADAGAKPACRSAPTCCWRSPIASKRGWRCWR